VLDEVTTSQARRIARARQPLAATDLRTIRAADIPSHLQRQDSAEADPGEWPGQYL
jgi:hypothetical protein